MKQADKMAKIRKALNEDFPPVMTPKQIAHRTGLSYAQVLRALSDHIRQEFKFDPFSQEFHCVGSRYQYWYYSGARCDPEWKQK